MKTILKYIFLAAVALIVAACQEGLDQISTDEGMGNVKLNISTNEHTRVGENFTPEELRVRIYDEDDRLVRIYTEDDVIPEKIALVAGVYTFKVEARDKDHTTKFKGSDVDDDRTKIYYIGEDDVTVIAGGSVTAEVECDPQHVRVGVILYEDEGENKYLRNVGISLAAIQLTTDNNPTAVDNKKKDDFDTAYAASTGVDRLDFGTAVSGSTASYEGEDYAYFLMPEGVSTISWVITGEHVAPAEDQPTTAAEGDSTEGSDSTGSNDGATAPEGVVTKFDRAGQIVVEPGKAYALQFRYSQLPDGSITIDVEVDETVETFDEQITFKPEPEIIPLDGNTWIEDEDNDNVYVVGASDISFNVTSINKIDGFGLNEEKLWNGDYVSDEAKKMITVTANGTDGKDFTVTVKPAFFATLAGGEQDFRLSAYDGTTEVGKFRTTFLNQGLVISETTSDLWANTATFKGVVTDTSATDVKVQFRKKGSTEWVVTDAATLNAGVATVTSKAAWTESKNVNDHTIFTPNTDKSIFANNTYEYQMIVGGVAYGPIVEYKTGSGQSIPYANFEDKLTCFNGGTVASIWGSGNNSASPELCTFSTFANQTGSNCAKLDATTAVGILAAGNLFTGKFDFNLLQGKGTVSFGVKYDYAARPSKLKLKIYHNIGTVDEGSGKIDQGKPDQGSIFVCLVDWDSQHQVSSGTSSPTGVWSPEDGADVVPSSGKIIGYGVVYPEGKTKDDDGNDVDYMVELEIPICYYDKVTKPSKDFTLVISAATSRYGDYKNGCKTNEMYVDDFQWVY
ncbi:MAG: PCMD domain-containing protein [Alistipes sp.]|nr:PCMD domain-containing protein [Alistipes sp.]